MASKWHFNTFCPPPENGAARTAGLAGALAGFDPAAGDCGKLRAALESFAGETERLLDGNGENGQRTAHAGIVGRLMNSVKMGHYPTCPQNLAGIAGGIEFREGRRVNLLDPCCGCGLALLQIAGAAGDAGALPATYGERPASAGEPAKGNRGDTGIMKTLKICRQLLASR